MLGWLPRRRRLWVRYPPQARPVVVQNAASLFARSCSAYLPGWDNLSDQAGLGSFLGAITSTIDRSSERGFAKRGSHIVIYSYLKHCPLLPRTERSGCSRRWPARMVVVLSKVPGRPGAAACAWTCSVQCGCCAFHKIEALLRQAAGRCGGRGGAHPSEGAPAARRRFRHVRHHIIPSPPWAVKQRL